MKAICRLRHGIVDLPCNWVKEGHCGADMKPCEILQFLEDKKKVK